MSSSATANRSEAPVRTRLIAVIDELPPNAFAAVMATGIFGVAVTHIVSPAIGMVLFVIAETFLLALLVGTIARAIRDRHGFAAAARGIGPALGWFTFPTAIAVSAALANALAIPGVRWPALIIAVLSWLFLSYVVLPTAFSRHKSSPFGRHGGRNLVAARRLHPSARDRLQPRRCGRPGDRAVGHRDRVVPAARLGAAGAAAAQLRRIRRTHGLDRHGRDRGLCSRRHPHRPTWTRCVRSCRSWTVWR